MKGTDLDSDPAELGGRAIHDAATVALERAPAAIEKIRSILDAKPAGTGEEGQRFDEAHDAVKTALNASDRLAELLLEMGSNILAGVAGTISDDELAARLVEDAGVHDIPDFKF